MPDPVFHQPESPISQASQSTANLAARLFGCDGPAQLADDYLGGRMAMTRPALSYGFVVALTDVITDLVDAAPSRVIRTEGSITIYLPPPLRIYARAIADALARHPVLRRMQDSEQNEAKGIIVLTRCDTP